MKTKVLVASAQGVTPTIPADLQAMFQAFMAQQALKSTPTVAIPAKVAKVAKVAKQPKIAVAPVQIHEAKRSFFVTGDEAPAKLAAFFTKKPHLDRGFKARTVLNGAKAYWFGGRQLEKVTAILFPKAK